MGTDDERLTALKKAYADIILNTSREAAARIMASERKALRFQHELQVVKEDALRTMLRIKQIMDSKICEAETTCLSQQRKIEELEAQLHEAEDIVSDLRGELREVHDALERVKINNKESRESAFCASDLHDVHVAVSDIRIMNPSARSEGLKSCSRVVHHTESSYLSHSDPLPSIILRSKEAELYRNGCTQRIRACEGNILGKKQSFSWRETEELKPESGDGKNKSDDSKKVSAVPDDADKKVVKEAGSFVFSGSFQRKKRRAKRCGKSRISLDGNNPPAPHFPIKTDEGQINNNSSSFDDGDEKKENKLVAFLKSSSHRKRKRADRQRKYRAALDGNLPVPGKDSSEVTPISSADRDDSQRESNGVEKAVSEHEGLVEANVLAAVLETGSTGSSGITVHNKSDAEDAAVGLLQSSKVCDVAAPKDENRTFKYTFQRKRKRGENAAAVADSVHKNCIEVMKNEEENKNVVSNDQQPKWPAESSRDSRRMAQVARQLISLSEKKWWQ